MSDSTREVSGEGAKSLYTPARESEGVLKKGSQSVKNRTGSEEAMSVPTTDPFEGGRDPINIKHKVDALPILGPLAELISTIIDTVTVLLIGITTSKSNSDEFEDLTIAQLLAKFIGNEKGITKDFDRMSRLAVAVKREETNLKPSDKLDKGLCDRLKGRVIESTLAKMTKIAKNKGEDSPEFTKAALEHNALMNFFQSDEYVSPKALFNIMHSQQ